MCFGHCSRPPPMTDFIAITTPSPSWITDLHSADRVTSYMSDFFALPVFYYFILFFHIFLFKYSDLKIGPAAYALTAKCLLRIFNDLRGGGGGGGHLYITYNRPTLVWSGKKPDYLSVYFIHLIFIRLKHKKLLCLKSLRLKSESGKKNRSW